MTGEIKTYAYEKKYGFIKGDENKDYYFNLKSFTINPNENHIVEGALVEFEQKATPKGYSAINLVLTDPKEINTYILPDKPYFSKENQIKGWDNISAVDSYYFTASSRNSPDTAKANITKMLMALKANAVLGMKYYTKTGSETTESGGEYKYTIHVYDFYIALIGKKKY